MIGSQVSLFHDLIDIQALHAPEAPAVISDYECLTYGELISEANRLAQLLIAAGVRPRSLVGICMERSTRMIVGVLAVLKAGAAYVPLDPTYPRERLAHMVADSGIGCVLAETTTVHALPESAAALSILADRVNLREYSSEPPRVAIDPGDLAYIIYTSGSTGTPKGVMIEHRNLSSLAEWTKGRFSFEQSRRVLASTSLSFDVSVFEFSTALVSGGALVIVRNVLDLILNPPREPISMIVSVPSPVAELVRAEAVPSSVNTIVVGGETLSRALANEIYATTRVRELINVWGVTEDTVGTTSYLVPRVSQVDPPIGEPMTGRRIHLLDAELQPVPPGTPGELCCSGSGVARGYLNRPELTRERFVRNPFGDSAYMYRSGDLAVQGEDGSIRFLGRNDQQVKVRGYRIELGEIEAALADHPLLAQVAVVANTTGEHAHLALFGVERQKGTVTMSVVEEFLSSRVPKHMIPSTVTILESMPLGPTGKTDRKTLQCLVETRSQEKAAATAGAASMEEAIAERFAALLGIERVGLHDNFFALGGQSLLATRAVIELRTMFPQNAAELEERYGERALFLAFWQQPTVHMLATALRTLYLNAPSISEIEGFCCLQRGAKHRVPFFLLHGVLVHEAFYPWNLSHALGADQPFYTIAPHGYQGLPIPETIEAMAADYVAKIRRIQPNGPYQLAGFCNGGIVCFEIARILEAMGETVSKLFLIAPPGRNTRFGLLASTIEGLRWIPGLHAKRRREIFRRLRALLSPRSQPLEFAQADKARVNAIIQAIEAYVPKRYHGEATLIYGEDDIAWKACTTPQDWKSVIPKLEVRTVPGDHHFIERRPEALIPLMTLLR